MVVYVCHRRTWDAETGGLGVEASLGYIGRPCFKQSNKNNSYKTG